MKLKQVHIKQQIRRKLLARPDFFCPNKKKKGRLRMPHYGHYKRTPNTDWIG